MKVGLSTYSLNRAIQSGDLTVLDAIDWIADNGGEHVEIVPIGYDLHGDDTLVQRIRERCTERGLDISNYAVGANFVTNSEDEFEQEIERVKKDVDIANALGVKRMRHDVANRSEPTIKHFHEDLPKLAEACQRIADYAKQYDITTSVENHGFYIQASDRVQALIHAVNRDNFKTTLDVGNFMCADEDPVAAVRNNISYASMVHLKDFYLRPAERHPGQGWMQTTSGNYLRGAIVGQGDIDMWKVMHIIKQSGYDGYISIEFEGLEDCRFGSKVGMENVKRIWDECSNMFV